MAPDVSQHFIDRSRQLLMASYLPRIERSVGGLSDQNVWWRASRGSNSIANLLLHLTGNVRQWLISGLGGAPDERQRQQEFEEQGRTTCSDLLVRLKETVEDGDHVLADIAPASLLEHRRIQGYDVTVFEAIHSVTEHFLDAHWPDYPRRRALPV